MQPYINKVIDTNEGSVNDGDFVKAKEIKYFCFHF